ncbi:hypothetical protein HK102_009331, partial [Quaeritorhiza haematococci]
PIYPNDTESPSSDEASSNDSLTRPTRTAPRYCNGRLKRWQFILLHILLLSIIFLAVLGPLAYFVIIPKIIRDKIASTPLDGVSLEKLDLFGFRSHALSFSVKASIPPVFPFPIRATIAPFTLYITDQNGTKLAGVQVPETTIQINQDIVIDWSQANITFASENGIDRNRVATMVKELSSKEGLKAQDVYAEAHVTFSVFGITVYRDFYISKGVPVPQTSSELIKLYNGLPAFVKTKNLNSQIKSKFNAKDLWEILEGLPAIKFDQIDISLTDAGPTLSTTLTLENPTVISANITGLDFGISLDDSTLARISIRDITLSRGLQTLSLVTSLRFDDPSIRGESVGRAIENTVRRVVVDGDMDLRVALRGPIRIHSAEFVEEISEPLALYLPTRELLHALNLPKVRSLLTLSGLQDLLTTTTFGAQVTSDTISITPIVVKLPRLIPLPPVVEFGYETSLGVYGGEQHTMTVGVGKVEVRTDDEGIWVYTSARVGVNNTEQAAVALASAVNPILAADPKVLCVSSLLFYFLVLFIVFGRDGVIRT